MRPINRANDKKCGCTNGSFCGKLQASDEASSPRYDLPHARAFAHSVNKHSFLQGAIAALQYRKLFPNTTITRSTEPWYANTRKNQGKGKKNGENGGNVVYRGRSLLSLIFHFAVLLLLR